MKVIKTRENRYHYDKECTGVERAKNQNEIELETTEAWDLEPCRKCVKTPEKVGRSKWSEFVREKRGLSES